MQTSIFMGLSLRLGLLLSLIGSQGMALAQGGDSLDRAAQPYVRAEKAVLMDIVRSGDRLVAVGEQGIVLLSDDSGRQWRQAKVPVSVALTRVVFPSPELGWAVGHSGVILHSDDHGDTWTRQLDGNQTAELERNGAQAEDDGSEQAKRRLHNADFLIKDGPDKPFLDVLFVDASHGWAVGAYGLIVATEDGGRTWRSLMGKTDNPKGLHFYRIAAQGEHLFIVGEQGLILRSDDQGQSFAQVATPYKGSLFGMSNGVPGTVLTYGLRGHAFRSDDAGVDWTPVSLDQNTTLTADARLRDGSVLLADETGRVLRSTDGARSFTPLKVSAQGYVAGLVEAADGALVIAGVRGVSRIETANLFVESKP